jgi:hypothetical protein
MGALYKIDVFKIMLRYKKKYSTERIAKELGLSVDVVKFIIEIESAS